MAERKRVTVHKKEARITAKNLNDPVIIKYPQIILGIHANAEAVGTYSNKGTIRHGRMAGAPDTEINNPWPDGGHIWLTVTRDGGDMVTYGLWKDGYVNPDETIKIKDNGPGSDIRVDIDKQTRPDPDDSENIGIGKVRRYYLLTIEQEKLLHDLLHKNVTYTAGWLNPSGYQCATWAADVVETVVGESYRPDQYGAPYQYSVDKKRGIVTPRIVAAMIQSYESRKATDNNPSDAKKGTKPSKNPPRIPAPTERIDIDPVAIGTP
jgi:hypothetical protein